MQQASPIVSPSAATVLLALVILLWGANWPIMKFGLGYIGPMSFVAARITLGALTLILVTAATGQLRVPARSDWPIVLSVGLVQMAGFMGLVTYALQHVPAGRSSILAYTTSLWVVPGAMIALRERLGGLKLAGFLLGISGVAVMFNPLGFDWTDPQVILGNGLLLLAAMLWATLIVQIRGHHWTGSPLALAPWQMMIAAAVLVPLAWLMEGDRAIDWGPELGWVFLYNGPVATAFCFWAMITVNRALPAITTSLGSLGVPVASVVFSALALGEPLTATNLTGLACIGSGLAFVTLADRGRG